MHLNKFHRNPPTNKSDGCTYGAKRRDDSVTTRTQKSNVCVFTIKLTSYILYCIHFAVTNGDGPLQPSPQIVMICWVEYYYLIVFGMYDILRRHLWEETWLNYKLQWNVVGLGLTLFLNVLTAFGFIEGYRISTLSEGSWNALYLKCVIITYHL